MKTTRDGDVKLTHDERRALQRVIVLRGLYPGECNPEMRTALTALAETGLVRLTYQVKQGDKSAWTFAQATDAGRALLRQR